MHSGRLLRIVLVILILGMGTFLVVRNINLKKQLRDGEITDITARDFLPFSGNGNGGGDGILDTIFDRNTEVANDQNQQEVKAHLTKVQGDVAGAILVAIPDEIAGPTGKDQKGNDIFDTVPALRYVTKENGYVYDYIPKYKKSYLISDTPIPKISFAHFSPDGNTVLFRYLDTDLTTEKSVLGTLGASKVTLLPNNIISFAFSKNGTFAYIQRAGAGGRVIVKNTDGKETTIYDSPLSEWNVSFLGEDKLLITTKASEYASGFAYTIDIKTKKAARLWSNMTGLTTKVSNSGNFILRAETKSAGPVLSLYNLKTGEVSDLNKMGMVEKCNFSADETMLTCAIPKSFDNKAYPDDWYLGIVKTDDAIIRYTTANKNIRVLTNPIDETNQEVDVWELTTNNAGNLTAFITRGVSDLLLYEE